MNHSNKKGFVHPSADASIGQKCKVLNVSWYYNWNYKPSDFVDKSIEFVPMMWGPKILSTKAGYNWLQRYPQMVQDATLLTYNEPDMTTQANMKPDNAVKLWKEIPRQWKRLVSPATTTELCSSQGWLAQFMKRLNTYRKPDVIAIHMYYPPHLDAWLKTLDLLHTQYDKPIWITEMSVANWHGPQYKDDQVYQLMQDLIPELEKRDFVERYCWKERNPEDKHMGSSSLFNDDGSLTKLGKLYASF